MGTAAEVVDGEVVGDQVTSTDIVPAQQAAATLFRTDDPVEVIERATKTADVLKDVLKRQGLTSRINNKDHVNVEGWQTCGGLLGVTPKKDWVRPIAWPADEFLTEALRKARDRGLTFGYESSYNAQFGGMAIGGAEATCKRTESKWLGSDDYAIESMAQTRATSKALGSVLRWIVTLAGYSGTPAEEMPDTAPAPAQPAQGSAPRTTAQPVQRSERPATAGQKTAINARCANAGLSGNEQKAVLQWVAGVAILDRISSPKASALVAALKRDGSGAAHILEDIRLAVQEGDERARKIAERYFAEEAVQGA